MEKNQSTGRLKLVLIIALAIIVLLVTITIIQLVNINIKNSEIQKQRAEIEQLYEQHEFYKSQANGNSGDDLVVQE